MNGFDPLAVFGGVMVDTESGDDPAGFVAAARTDLERALVARFGLHDGMEAAASAIDYANQHWRRLEDAYRIKAPVTLRRPLDAD